jgi:hypothetical protein
VFPITAAQGGTGISSYAVGDVIYANGLTSFGTLHKPTVFGALSMDSTGTPTWAEPSIPQNSKSANYTLIASDNGKHIFHPSADTTARTITIPANVSVSFPVGACVTFVNQAGAGTLSIAIATDTMYLAGAGTTGTRTLAANGVCTALKITSNAWIISGTGLT